MAHVVLLEDKNGNTVDQHTYCSDYCAQSDPAYAGWYGCVELYAPEVCGTCGATLGYWDDSSGEWIEA